VIANVLLASSLSPSSLASSSSNTHDQFFRTSEIQISDFQLGVLALNVLQIFEKNIYIFNTHTTTPTHNASFNSYSSMRNWIHLKCCFPASKTA
jgi:hypothetical protein